MEQPLDREVIKRYFLGGLNEGERESVGARLLSDDESFSVAQDVENDLMDALARGELSQADADAVRRFVAESAQGRRLVFAQALGRTPRRTFRGPVVVRGFLALAAVLLVAMVGAVYNARRHKPAILPDGSPQSPAIYAIVLPPAVTRGSQAVTKISIPKDARVVELKSDVEPGYPGYIAILRPVGGEPIRTQQTLENGRLKIDVEPRFLPAGKYEVAISGVRAQNAIPEPLAFQYFIVE